MNLDGKGNEGLEISEPKGNYKSEFSKDTLDKFDKIMEDDKLDSGNPDVQELTDEEREDKLDKLFEIEDVFPEQLDEEADIGGKADHNNTLADMPGTIDKTELFLRKEANSEYEIDGDIYETDDNGDIYKKNGELLPDVTYIVNGSKYKTDDNGNKISCDPNLIYTEDGKRNIKEQIESGGAERREDDDGGHIVARILGGAEGVENLVPMRRTINRGDYKKMENEIAGALQEGKRVWLHIDLEYEAGSHRPSKICAEYIIDDVKTVVEFDNTENSIDLLKFLADKIKAEDFKQLCDRIEDMKSDGIETTVTSVKTEYDKTGNPAKITVGILDESTGEKRYLVYQPK